MGEITKESVEGIADKILGEFTGAKMKGFLKETEENLQLVSTNFMHICWRGGIGNGREYKWRGIYLTNKSFSNHIKELPDFEHYLAASTIIMVQMYRWAGIILNHISSRLVWITMYAKKLLRKLNETLKKNTQYNNIQELLDDGMCIINLSLLCCN